MTSKPITTEQLDFNRWLDIVYANCIGVAVVAAGDYNPAPRGSESWPKDSAHRDVVDVIHHIAGGHVSVPARQALRETLDKADAPPVGKAKSDQAIGNIARIARS